MLALSPRAFLAEVSKRMGGMFGALELNEDVFGGRVKTDGGARPGAGLLLYLSPVILLNLVYPLVSPAMAAVDVGGVQLTLVVLASSITVPWLAQAACLPAYRAIGDLMAERDIWLSFQPFSEDGYVPQMAPEKV